MCFPVLIIGYKYLVRNDFHCVGTDVKLLTASAY